MKRVFILLLSAVLLLSATLIPIHAATDEDYGVMPCWTNTCTISVHVVFIDGVGYAEAMLVGYPTSSRVRIDVTVYKQSGSDWEYLAEKHVDKAASLTDISCPFEIVDGGYYKADYTFTVTDNGFDEVVTRTAYDTYTAP